MKLPGRVIFYVFDNGDASTGTPPNQSIVDTWIQDTAHLEQVRSELREFFSDLHDCAATKVVTDSEFEAEATTGL